MGIRILHCGESIENYKVCAIEKVAGFKKRVASKGDLIYLTVKQSGTYYCGMRAIISEPTDRKPWQDSEKYVQSFTLEKIEYCKPFDLGPLAEITKQWYIKFIQSAKEIKVNEAINTLSEKFKQNKSEFFMAIDEKSGSNQLSNDDIEEDEIKITETFVNLKFITEQNKSRGLETLVSKNFYSLFEEYPEESTILINDNRLFLTSTIKDEKTNKKISGISGIPDAVLIQFNQEEKSLRVNIIEYECYGEKYLKAIQKFEHLNGHIIPQLIRFASTFSISTDTRIRNKTMRNWVRKINDYIYYSNNVELVDKVFRWMKSIYPEINVHTISDTFKNLIEKSLETNLRIILIIDELPVEQKETISNVLKSFKLTNDKSIDFISYVVRLEQKIKSTKQEDEFALSIQK